MIIIDGVDLPPTVTYEVSSDDLDSSDTGRNEEGGLQRDRIREGVRKIVLAFSQMNEEQTALIMSATKKPQLSVKYLDPEEGEVTRTMYATPKKTKLIYITKQEKRWNIDFSLVEI